MTTEPPETSSSSAPELHETPEEIEYELRVRGRRHLDRRAPPDRHHAFFFASLAFAYFYLRSANNEDALATARDHRPDRDRRGHLRGRRGERAYSNVYGTVRLRQGETLDWEVAGWTAVLGGLVAIGLQIWQLTELPFFPGSSGYASCFIGWAVMNIVLLLGGVYWLETTARPLAPAAAGGDRGRRCCAIRHCRWPACSGPTSRRARTSGGSSPSCDVLFWVLFYVI